MRTKFSGDITCLTEAQVPDATPTYVPVSHVDLHNKTMAMLQAKGISVIDVQFKTNQLGTRAIATYHLDYDNPNFCGMLAWRNSYDRSQSVAIAAGASVFICGNGAVVGELKFLHRHQSDVLEEIDIALEEQIGKVEFMIEKSEALFDKLYGMTWDTSYAGGILGELYLKDVLNTHQLQVIKGQIESPSYDYGTAPDNLWTLFNHITHALKTTRPSIYFETHLKVVDYFENIK